MASLMACTSSAAVAAAAPLVTGRSSNASRSSSSLVAMAPFRASSLNGQRLQIAPLSAARTTMSAGTAEKPAENPLNKAPEGFTPPTLNPDTPSPIFGGSTGGLLRKAQVEEFHVITWESKKEQIFELPTGGAAIMRNGPNLLKLSRKEQCLALGSQFRNKFKIDFQVYRVFPNGEVQYLHPKDGQYPEKVTPGREAVGIKDRSIGKNANPATIKFTGIRNDDL